MNLDNYFSILEASEAGGLSPSRLAFLCRQGKLEGAVKVGRDWRIPKSAVLNYVPGPKGPPRKNQI